MYKNTKRYTRGEKDYPQPIEKVGIVQFFHLEIHKAIRKKAVIPKGYKGLCTKVIHCVHNFLDIFFWGKNLWKS